MWENNSSCSDKGHHDDASTSCWYMSKYRVSSIIEKVHFKDINMKLVRIKFFDIKFLSWTIIRTDDMVFTALWLLGHHNNQHDASSQAIVGYLWTLSVASHLSRYMSGWYNNWRVSSCCGQKDKAFFIFWKYVILSFKNRVFTLF